MLVVPINDRHSRSHLFEASNVGAMRAAVLDQPAQPLVLQDIDIAAPGPGMVSVRVHHCGICHSDLTMIDSPTTTAIPAVLGHEAAGVIAEIGPGVTRVAIGDRVVISALPSCGQCYYCTRNQPTLCAPQATLTGLWPDGTSPLSRGGQLVYRGLGVAGFAEYAVVDQNAAVKVPDDIPLDIASVIGCAVQTGVGSVINTAKVEPGATVLVLGAGGIGMSVVLGAKIAGASRIIVSDPVAERRDMAANFGATDLVDPTNDDVIAKSYELTDGIGVDYAFDAAGSAALVKAGLFATRMGGTTVMVGAPGAGESLVIDPAVLMVVTEKRLLGTLYGSCQSQRDVLRILAWWRQGRIDLERMVTRRRPLAEINEGLDDLRAARGLRTVLSC